MVKMPSPLARAIFLFYGFGHAMLAGADLLFAAFCCIFPLKRFMRMIGKDTHKESL